MLMIHIVRGPSKKNETTTNNGYIHVRSACSRELKATTQNVIMLKAHLLVDIKMNHILNGKSNTQENEPLYDRYSKYNNNNTSKSSSFLPFFQIANRLRKIFSHLFESGRIFFGITVLFALTLSLTLRSTHTPSINSNKLSLDIGVVYFEPPSHINTDHSTLLEIKSYNHRLEWYHCFACIACMLLLYSLFFFGREIREELP